MRKIVATTKAPAAIGPYAQANIIGNFVFTSGQLGMDPATGKLAGENIEAQTEQALKNLEAVLAANDMTFANVVFPVPGGP